MGQPSDPIAADLLVLRPVGLDDTDFLRNLYATTREHELRQSGMSPEQQLAFVDFQFKAQSDDYTRRFPHAEHSVIVYRNVSVGRLYVARSTDEIRILDVTILPAHRNTGIGSCVLKPLLLEADDSRVPVRIYVENNSPANHLFDRLGFSPIERQSLISLLEWRSAD